MPSDEQTTTTTKSEETTTAATTTTTTPTESLSSEAVIEQERSEKILKAKELYSHGSRNFLVKSYAEAADELSQVCALYEELHGELSDELGMPYLLYAKSLIALALDENKVIDVPDEEEDDEEEEEGGEGEEEENGAAEVTESTNGEGKPAGTNGTKLESIKEDADDGADSTEKVEKTQDSEKSAEESQVSSTDDDKAKAKAEAEKTKSKNGEANGTGEASAAATSEEKPVTTKPVVDDEKPSTSNGDATLAEEEEEENEAATNLQLAWEILELAAKIFSRQGESGLPNLAEVQTELGNIEFENNILDAARDDYDKALTIYKELPTNYRRPMAEIHYKIGLTYLMQQANKEGAAALKEACNLIAGEIDEIKAKKELNEKDKNNIQDMEETKQEIEAKITEIEETQAQNIAEVRAALDSYIKPMSSGDVDAGSSKSSVAASATSSSSAKEVVSVGITSSSSTTSSSLSSSAAGASAITSSSKPTDISHLIKRKKPEEPTSEAEAAVACSPAKRPAV